MKRHFPMMIDISSWKVLVVGGGEVGVRRFSILSNFSKNITLVSPVIKKDIKEKTPTAVYIEREFEVGDLEGKDLVIIATDNKILNERIYLECKKRDIPSNNASDREQCDFYFPAIIMDKDVTIGITSSKRDIDKVQKIKEDIVRELDDKYKNR